MRTPLWAVLPFAVYLAGLALAPALLGHLWERNRNKLIAGLLVSSPVIVYLATAPHGWAALAHTMCDYLSFLAVLVALFTISGGLCLRSGLVGTPLVNTGFLAAGALLASFVGTTGASVLLVRPLLRANERRTRVTHVAVFFIFVVSNAGGLLTPLGDPPLFLGFLRGVPFAWTLRLAPQWAFVTGALLAVFAAVDRLQLAREPLGPSATRGAPPVEPSGAAATLRLEGTLNLAWLAIMIAFVFLVGSYGERFLGEYPRLALQIAGTLGLAALAYRTTPAHVHEINRFSWHPIAEVAAVFVGVFITMVPAMSFVAERGASLGLTRPWHFFWATGLLSGVLDNAPTYLTFASLATGVVNDLGGASLARGDLGALAAHPLGGSLLAAISSGAVFMGGLTYLGNGPNFMVKAIAEQHRVRMPSFLGFCAWSFAVLLPVLGLTTWLFF
jgi:Na+/H+ antiporter NhaD/arsenite permease-like protein